METHMNMYFLVVHFLEIWLKFAAADLGKE